MTTNDRSLKSIQRELEKKPMLPAQAAALGYEVFRFVATHETRDGKETEGLVNTYRAYINTHQLQGLLRNQIDYAMRLAEHDLIFEEVFKLLTLCDEIEALKRIGLEADAATYTLCQKSVRLRLNKQPKHASEAAKCLVEDWKRNWWWYSEHVG